MKSATIKGLATRLCFWTRRDRRLMETKSERGSSSGLAYSVICLTALRRGHAAPSNRPVGLSPPPVAQGSDASPAARNTLDSVRIPRASKLLICGLFQKGRVLAQDGQSSAYLSRRTLSHARSTERLDEHLELLRCYYNFVRPHGALKFGREIRTPAMQAGLTTRWLTFRDIFLATTISLWSRIEVFLLTGARNPVSSAPCTTARSRVATLDGGSTGSRRVLGCSTGACDVWRGIDHHRRRRGDYRRRRDRLPGAL